MSEEQGKYSAGRSSNAARAIAEKSIIYRPSLKKMTGSTNGSILLQQIMYRWYSNGEKPFYKFLQPCEHELYRSGDSWSEEIGFSYSELQTALDKFAVKITAGISKAQMATEKAVIYWTDADRVTWWQFNPDVFDLLYNSEESNYIESENPRNTLIGINTETTTNSVIDSANRTVDGILQNGLSPKAIQDAIANHFKLTPRWQSKFEREWMQWAIEAKVTPEQVKAAAELWRIDRRFNWQAPNLKGIHDHWLELTARGDAQPVDDNNGYL